MITIKLTKKQRKELAPVFIMSLDNPNGMILAQVFTRSLFVNFVDHDTAAKIMKITNPENYSVYVEVGIIKESSK
jgi:hypothetical protein